MHYMLYPLKLKLIVSRKVKRAENRKNWIILIVERYSLTSSIKACLTASGSAPSDTDKELPFFSALLRKPRRSLERKDILKEQLPFSLCLCTFSRSLSMAFSLAISWSTGSLSKAECKTKARGSKIKYRYTRRVLWSQIFQDLDSFLKESLFSQSLPFSEHCLIIVVVLSQRLWFTTVGIDRGLDSPSLPYQLFQPPFSNSDSSDGMRTYLHISFRRVHRPVWNIGHKVTNLAEKLTSVFSWASPSLFWGAIPILCNAFLYINSKLRR